MTTLTQARADGYALGRSEAETNRLILQNQIYGPITRRLLVDAGILAGMRVLDIGSGGGDVALALAELVGPRGRGVGVDHNDAILETAQARVAAAGWASTVVFRNSDVEDLPRSETYDAVVGRWVLMYLPDPARVLRELAERVRPGGVVVFQESDLSTAARAYPPRPLHTKLSALMAPSVSRAGDPDIEMGPKLFHTFVESGLPEPHLLMDAPVGGGADWPGFRYLAETMRSLAPFLERLGLVQADELDIDTLADRLRAEVTAVDGIQILPAVVGAWTRR
jgi:ubiquinone/menaquinone biosynthesis C-methylase UbiE